MIFTDKNLVVKLPVSTLVSPCSANFMFFFFFFLSKFEYQPTWVRYCQALRSPTQIKFSLSVPEGHFSVI